MTDLDQEIEQAEQDWRKLADPDLKRVAEDLCKELYKKREARDRAGNGKRRTDYEQ